MIFSILRKPEGSTWDAFTPRWASSCAAKIGRSKSTLSKYEKGEIALDLETLYALAELYRVHVEQLLPRPETAEDEDSPAPAFFAGLKQFYGYLFDGRDNSIIRCVFEVQAE